ncbi:MAG: hypothetical protein V1731_03570 [Candidatus Aenigmatarchaeota archaeon]
MPEHKKSISIKLPKFDLWMVSTLVLIIVLVVSNFGGISSNSNDLAAKAIDYINSNIVQGGGVSFVSVKDSGAFYEVTTLYQGQEIPIYVTKDGAYVFLSQPAGLKPESTTTTLPQAIPKTDNPKVELFVMSFCPYGAQAENFMKPVVDLIGSKIDMEVRFIASVAGTTTDSVDSLHGANEAMEDLRQLCIMKNYVQADYWKYLAAFNNDCTSMSQNANALDTCWKASATSAGMNVDLIDSCSKGSEAIDLLKSDEIASQQYNAYNSPTLIINGINYNGARTSEAFKQAICSAFNNVPSECAQTLSNSASAAGGAC